MSDDDIFGSEEQSEPFDLGAIEQAALAATQGPWRYSLDKDDGVHVRHEYIWGPKPSISGAKNGDYFSKDMQFIAAANPAVVLELVRRLRAAEQRLANAEAVPERRQWQIYVEDTPTPDDAKRELSLLIDGTAEFAGRVVMLVDENGMCPAVTGCGPMALLNAELIVAAMAAAPAPAASPYANEDADTRAILEADDRGELVSIGDVPMKALFGKGSPASPVVLSYQARVQDWMQECFGPVIAADAQERNHRFLEEALELVQSCGATADECQQLVGYVFGRPVGEKSQEVGGVRVTLSALCTPHGIDEDAAAETELARITQPEIVLKIREKQKRKPAIGPLPGCYPERLPASDLSGSD